MEKTFDEGCYDLAKRFLSDMPPRLQTEEIANELAYEIQVTIENFLEVKGNE